MSRICRGCGGVLGRDCYHEADCMSISDQMAQQSTQDFHTSLDYIKELCDILENAHTRNHQETLGNAIMNAMAFYDNFRPRMAPVKSPPYEVDGLPF